MNNSWCDFDCHSSIEVENGKSYNDDTAIAKTITLRDLSATLGLPNRIVCEVVAMRERKTYCQQDTAVGRL